MKRAHIVLGTTILALGIFSLIPIIRATEPPEVEANDSAIDEPFASNAGVSLRLPLQASENFSYGAVAQSSTGEPSASELNRQLTNPVSSIWSISNQFNNFELNNGQWNNNWNFQPVLPHMFALTADSHRKRPSFIGAAAPGSAVAARHQSPRALTPIGPNPPNC